MTPAPVTRLQQAPIADHGMIGDGRSAALVARGGTIDWLCWPDFDSPACCASVLGTPEHGHWTVAPDTPAIVTMQYRAGTMVLETQFRTEDGEVALYDLMDRADHTILRLVEGRRGSVAMRMRAALRFDYGAAGRSPAAKPGGAAFAGCAALFSDQMLQLDGCDVNSAFTVAAGARAWFGWGAEYPADPWARLNAAPVLIAPESRSLLTLLALCTPSGAMLAAPTTSLPEQPGGSRNWDYRFCWLRDSALAAQTLLRAGQTSEVARWRDWVRRTVDPAQPRALYAVSPGIEVTERTLDWLPGHAGARPVRIGNGAAGQLQIDAIGVLIQALAACRNAGLGEPAGQWAFECALLAQLETIWREPDEGIWEVRGGRRHFTYSKAMAWAAFDRAIAAAERFRLPAPLADWRRSRDAVRRLILTQGLDAARGCFTQSFGRPELDASLLLLSAVGFLPPDDPRMRRTVDAVAGDLMRGGFLLRYDTASTVDGLAPGEGAFLPCSFWLADAWARDGRRDEARALFNRLRACANELGLLSEEIDPASSALLGNFPQAFSHLALIDSAMLLEG